MRLNNLLIMTLLLIISSCSKYRVDTQRIPDLSLVTELNIDSDLPIISISVNQEQFDFMVQFYANDTIIPAFLKYYNPSGSIVFENASASLEIKGAASAKNEMKSLGFILDSAIDNSKDEIIIPSKVLENHSLEELKSFRLRNSGNDFGFSMIKDRTYTQLAIEAEADLDLMYGKPVHAFVNGSYYGLLNLRTESNVEGISRLRNVSTERITLLKVDVDNGKLEFRDGDEVWADKFLKAIKDENLNELWDMIEINNYIDYIVFQDYIGNRDWPKNNMRAYCIDQGKFRFFLYDLDYAAFHNKNDIIPTFEFEDHQMAKIYRILREHKDFEKIFEERQKSLYSRLSFSTFSRIMDGLVEEIQEEMPYLIAKYQLPKSEFHWKLNLSNVRRDFERRDVYIRDKYDL
tara:strand:+ start:99361 stop:100572 length:1212 start_codon:yes stop_codon:yes gene_type:complete